MKKIGQMIIVFILIICTLTNRYNYSECTGNRILNAKSLSCINCSTNTMPNPSILFPLSCMCSAGFKQSTFGNCIAYSMNCSAQNQIYGIFDETGQSQQNISCLACHSDSYPNINKTYCIPCQIGMTYQIGQGCICKNLTSQIKTKLGCFANTVGSGLSITNSIYYEQLKYLVPGCLEYQDTLSCSQLLNLCTYSQGANTPQCNFWEFANKSSLLNYDTSNAFKLGSSEFSKGSSLNFKLLKYAGNGNFLGEKDMVLEDIFRCGLPSDTTQGIIIGSNIESNCQFNFNNLVADIYAKNYQNYVYQLFIKGQSGLYFEVAVHFKGLTTPLKRFFLEDAYTNPKKLKILTSLTFSLTLNTAGELTLPSLYVSYQTVSIEDGIGITPVSDQLKKLHFSIHYNYDLGTFWNVIIPIFITVNILALLHTIIRTYIGYLNRKSPLQFFINFLRIWSLWMFYLLFIISGYWFIFLKATQQSYIFLPNGYDFYIAFYIVSAIMGVFRILYIIIDKLAKLNMEVFLINWERGAHKNSWRQIFIINSLAEFYKYRTVSLFWMLFWLLFFLTGLHWENHSAQTFNTNLSQINDTNPKNRVLLFFLGCSIFWLIGIIFKILRRLSVLIWPYPFEDFVDYCNVTNISFLFIRKRSPQAFYIHASIPDRTEVSHKQLNQAVQRGLQKNRSVTRQISHPDHLRLYLVYMSSDLQDQFNLMLRKIQDQDHNRRMKYSSGKKSKKEDYREQFIQTKLKPRLEQIARQGSNRTKTITQSYCGFPPVDLRDPNSLKRQHVLFDQNNELVQEVFPNGNQFEDIHTLIIIFLLWNLLISSSPISAFLTFLIDEYIFNGYIEIKCRSNLEAMTKVKQGFML